MIGRGGRHVSSGRALDHVAGYTSFVDGSVRDFQKFSVTSGKNFPAPGRSGPGWSPRMKFPIQALSLTTRLNGKRSSTTAPTR